jgi:60 kDa SS-A/Ro ribonucleoprotein
MVRMNLNTFERHGVFKIKGMDKVIAQKLTDEETIRKAMVFPYQLLVAYQNATGVPHVVREALQDAMELATNNVPAFGGKVVVAPDVSGSMGCAVTGNRGRATSTVSCRDVAALVSAVVLRNNRDALVLPFSDRLNTVSLNPRDSVMTNAEILRRLPSGGTDCSLPLEKLNKDRTKANLVIYVSDYESWVRDRPRYGSGWLGYGRTRSTTMMKEWNAFKARNPGAKLVTIDLVPNQGYHQVESKDEPDILKVGGFSDRVFDVIRDFAQGGTGPDHWITVVESINLDELGRKVEA